MSAADSLILGIESSCDDTAAAVVAGGRRILSSVVRGQAELHAPFGGVVPEIAGRSHLDCQIAVLDEALARAGVELGDLSAIAVTARPGLIGSLLVGLSVAKGLALAAGLPLVDVHHIEAHAWAPLMGEPDVELPALCLVVSGGHTALYLLRGPADMERLGGTLDDAAGEAFDKVASLLGLGYPGGPEISRLAAQGDPGAIEFPRYRAPKGRVAFSFSGLKTAVLYHLRGQNALAPTPEPGAIANRADVAASFEAAAVEALVGPTLAVARERGLDTILVSGGVAANRRLRAVLGERAAAEGRRAIFPPPELCTDNAAMVAGLGHHLFAAGRRAGWELDASPR